MVRNFLAIATLGLLQACSSSHAHPCQLITPEMGATLLGVPAVTREAWKLDNEAVVIGGRRGVPGWSQELGYRFVHACSIEAVDAAARDRGKATTVFFVEYVDKERANSAYAAVKEDSTGRLITVPKVQAFTTADPQTDEVLSVWLLKNRMTVDFSVGTADAAAMQLFASRLARSL